jgi:very-short-patch-repair endonuclease
VDAECRLTAVYREELDTRRADASVAALAGSQWGVVDVDQLHAAGLNDRAIARRVERGLLHPKHRGVYAVGHPHIPLEGRFLAALRACGEDAVLCHRTAAARDGYLPWRGGPVDVLVLGTTTRVHDGIRTHRTRRLQPDEVARRDGIAATTPARTLVDLASVLDPKTLRRAVREAQAQRLVTHLEIVRTLERLRPCRGARRLATILATGPAPTRSELEDLVLDLILNAGFSKPAINVPIQIQNTVVIPDFRWPAQRLVVESDGAQWHDNPLARADDADRQALLEAHGERVVRVRWHEVVGDRARTVARLRAAGAPRLGDRT